MEVYLGFAKRDLDSGFKAGECCLVQPHEPKGGDLKDFDWRTVNASDFDAAYVEYAPISNDFVMVARYEVLDDDEIMPSAANKERLKAARDAIAAKHAVRQIEGMPIDPREAAQLASLGAQLRDGLWTRFTNRLLRR